MAEHYTVLGVSRDATEEDIRKAYRKMAIKCGGFCSFEFAFLLRPSHAVLLIPDHPDKNNSDPDCAKIFQDVCDAYQTLSEPSARLRYDQFGSGMFTPTGPSRSASDIFNDFVQRNGGNNPFSFNGCGFGDFNQSDPHGPQKLQPVQHRIACTLGLWVELSLPVATGFG